MGNTKLSLSVIEIRAQGLPNRQIELPCNITNHTQFDICILDAWLKIEALNGFKLAEGKLFYTMHNRVDPATIKPGQQGLGAIIIPLLPSTLQHIEEKRAGGDIAFRILSRVLACEVCNQSEVQTLGIPFETQFENYSLGYFDYKVPQSEWIKVLKGLEWSELELLEIPLIKLRTIPELARALQHFENAKNSYRHGNWAETMVNCRKVFEALIKDVNSEDTLKESSGFKAFESLLGEARKAEPLNKMSKEFAAFLHLARHEQLPAVQIKPEDARLAIHLTGALLVYLGS